MGWVRRGGLEIRWLKTKKPLHMEAAGLKLAEGHPKASQNGWSKEESENAERLQEKN